jgi:DNA-binding MarR family transcriptional regulator
MPNVDPEICNCGALRQAARRVTKLYDDALAPVGLGVNQFSILARLNRVGPITIRELAQLLVMDRSTLAHLLRPLDKRGFVQLEVSERDRRSRMVKLTQAGKAAVAKARPRWATAASLRKHIWYGGRSRSSHGSQGNCDGGIRLAIATTISTSISGFFARRGGFGFSLLAPARLVGISARQEPRLGH